MPYVFQIARPTVNKVYVYETDSEIYPDSEADDFYFIPESVCSKINGLEVSSVIWMPNY